MDAESARIARTQAGLADAQARLAELQGRVDRRRAQTDAAQTRLVRARIRLTRLERRNAQAKVVLSRNLVAGYQAGKPDVVSVVMDSNGFADLLERVHFYDRVAKRNGEILDDVRTTRVAVAKQAVQLKALRLRLQRLTAGAVEDRDEADVIRQALLRRESAQLERRAGSRTRLRSVRAKIASLEAAQRLAARRAAQAAAASAVAAAPRSAAVPVSSGGGGGGGNGSSSSPAPSGNASGAVAKVVAAANEIAGTPYVWGGGHGGASGGYDCSGSLSYALAAAGLVSSPLTSGAFMSWGDAGPGQHITVYANAGHAYMVVDGRRYDTSALSQGGTRWTSEMRSSAGFVARHPPGL